MKRRESPFKDDLPDWWWSCTLELWSPRDLCPIEAVQAWHRARSDWADARGLDRRELPSPRNPVPSFADGCGYSGHRFTEACDQAAPPA